MVGFSTLTEDIPRGFHLHSPLHHDVMLEIPGGPINFSSHLVILEDSKSNPGELPILIQRLAIIIPCPVTSTEWETVNLSF